MLDAVPALRVGERKREQENMSVSRTGLAGGTGAGHAGAHAARQSPL